MSSTKHTTHMTKLQKIVQVVDKTLDASENKEECILKLLNGLKLLHLKLLRKLSEFEEVVVNGENDLSINIRFTGKDIFSTDAGDLVIIIVNRSLRLIEAYSWLITQRNFVCAEPLLRLQIDSLMRMNSTQLFENPTWIVNCFLQDQELKKIKSKEGQSLTDRYLYTKISEIYPGLDELYKRCSASIHLSKPLLAGLIKDTSTKNKTITWRVSLDSPAAQYTDEDTVSALKIFYLVTTCLIDFLNRWIDERIQARGKGI